MNERTLADVRAYITDVDFTRGVLRGRRGVNDARE